MMQRDVDVACPKDIGRPPTLRARRMASSLCALLSGGACASAVVVDADSAASSTAPEAPALERSVFSRAQAGPLFAPGVAAHAPHDATSNVRAPGYHCPMHADVTSSAVGTCPKCGMALVADTDASLP